MLRVEGERRQKEDSERKARMDTERKIRKENDRKTKLELERRERVDGDKRMAEQSEKKRKTENEKKIKEEWERKKQVKTVRSVSRGRVGATTPRADEIPYPTRSPVRASTPHPKHARFNRYCTASSHLLFCGSVCVLVHSACAHVIKSFALYNYFFIISLHSLFNPLM